MTSLLELTFQRCVARELLGFGVFIQKRYMLLGSKMLNFEDKNYSKLIIICQLLESVIRSLNIFFRK